MFGDSGIGFLVDETWCQAPPFSWGTRGKVLEDARLQAKSLQGDHWAGAWWRSILQKRNLQHL